MTRLFQPPALPLARLARRALPRRYVVVHGFYGMDNVGDDAILEAAIRQIRETTTLEPYVFAWNADAVRARYGVESMVPHKAPPRAVLRVLLQSEAYLLGGGGLLKDYGASSASLFRWLKWMEASNRLGVKTMTWSVGVENLHRPASLARVREVLSQADAVTVRDQNSAERLRDLGLTRPVLVTADPVPALARRYRQPRPVGRGGLRVAVCLREWYTSDNRVTDGEAFSRFLDHVARACDRLHAERGAEITFVPFRTAKGDDDREVAAQVAHRMTSGAARVLTSDVAHVDETIGLLRDADLVLAMRLHAAVLATSLGVPTLAFAYMPKVADYMAEIGQAEFCTSPESATEAWILDNAARALKTDPSVLLDRTDRLAQAFTKNADTLRALCAPRYRRSPQA